MQVSGKLHACAVLHPMEIAISVNNIETERSKASTFFGRSNVEIAGSNPARGMDVCLRFSVLCCPV
jgi:hypothetical protein